MPGWPWMPCWCPQWGQEGGPKPAGKPRGHRRATEAPGRRSGWASCRWLREDPQLPGHPRVSRSQPQPPVLGPTSQCALGTPGPGRLQGPLRRPASAGFHPRTPRQALSSLPFTDGPRVALGGDRHHSIVAAVHTSRAGALGSGLRTELCTGVGAHGGDGPWQTGPVATSRG